MSNHWSPPLVPPNAPLLEQALDEASKRILDINTNLRRFWSADDCPEDHLPWLAWQLSLDNWSPHWSAAIKRNRIRQAIHVARRKGTAESVRIVVNSFGGGVAIREWWEQDPPGQPYTFDLTLNLDQAGAPASAAFVDSVMEEVRRTKPVTRHFTFTQGLNGVGQIGLIGAARIALYARLSLDAEPAPPPLSVAHNDGSFFSDGSGYSQPQLD